jgi:hypothetical protein
MQIQEYCYCHNLVSVLHPTSDKTTRGVNVKPAKLPVANGGAQKRAEQQTEEDAVKS